VIIFWANFLIVALKNWKKLGVFLKSVISKKGSKNGKTCQKF
jgi:hypothetical protein